MVKFYKNIDKIEWKFRQKKLSLGWKLIKTNKNIKKNPINNITTLLMHQYLKENIYTW